MLAHILCTCMYTGIFIKRFYYQFFFISFYYCPLFIATKTSVEELSYGDVLRHLFYVQISIGKYCQGI